MIQFILEIPLSKPSQGLKELFTLAPAFELHTDLPTLELLAWGDPIKGEGFDSVIGNNPGPEFILQNIYGHYHFLLMNKKTGELIIGNSLFSILPIYYTLQDKKLIFSHNTLTLGEHIVQKTISRRFILETILFNYPLFNHSFLEAIKLLPSNSYIRVSGSLYSIIKHTRIESLFSSSLIPWRKSLNNMSDLFLDSVRKYLPEKPFVSALTGGFDGRALVSAALYHKKDFSCYSFGSSFSNDTRIAEGLAEKAGIRFRNISLDEAYTMVSNLKNGLEFIVHSSGSGSFARAHYLYAAKLLAKETECLITGNFGSEVFRAAHKPGVIFLHNLIELFRAGNFDKSLQYIENSNAFTRLNKSAFVESWEELCEDLKTLPAFHPDYVSLTRNQQFYVFVFEEVFRKYFGAEMVNQFHYLKNRTPFLDIDFVKGILNTGLAGIHSKFFEHNPFKRYKGQMLYAHIIRKAYPAFGKEMTDKGYRPDDLLSVWGTMNILKGYIHKRVNRPDATFDPYVVRKAYEVNMEFFKRIPVDSELFNTDLLNSQAYKKPDEWLFKTISLSYLKNQSEK